MRLPRRRMPYIALALGALALVLLANAHLLYVAAGSQPECVPHLKAGESAGGAGGFSAAKPSC